jgi:tetratricopeptide (TPR) repeat protein
MNWRVEGSDPQNPHGPGRGSARFSRHALRQAPRPTSPTPRWVGRAGACLLVVLAACATEPPPQKEAKVATPALLDRAERSRSRGDYDAAIRDFKELVERVPWNDRAKEALAGTYADRAAKNRDAGKLPSAEEDLREAVAVLPNDATHKRNLAIVLYERASFENDPQKAAGLRKEAKVLSPDLDLGDVPASAALERRLDMAFDLVQRGQVEAGIRTLEQIHRDYPEDPSAARLLAQALVKHAGEFSERKNYPAAAGVLDQAVGIYAKILPCDGKNCKPAELRLAHHNRVVAWLNAYKADEARRALEDAERVGLKFPDLRAAVKEAGNYGQGQ